jgi:hypothetical protein
MCHDCTITEFREESECLMSEAFFLGGSRLSAAAADRRGVATPCVCTASTTDSLGIPIPVACE